MNGEDLKKIKWFLVPLREYKDNMFFNFAIGNWRTCLEYVLNNGANFKTKDSDGNTPLMHAISKNFIELAEKFLEKGADVNEQNHRGFSPLHIAVSQGYIELATSLIRFGADIDSRTEDGVTPLHIVVHTIVKDRTKSPVSSDVSPLVSFEFCKLLIGEGADLNVADKNGSTVLHRAVEAGNVILTKLLLSKNVAIDLSDVDGNTPLLTAFNRKSATLCNLLINEGANVNVSDKNGNTPLHLLIVSNFLPCSLKMLFKKLLHKGANINKKNTEGDTVLLLAIKHKLPQDFIMLLIKKGADINVQNNIGDSALLLALKCMTNHYTVGNPFRNVIPEKLILRGANVNVQDNKGETPLHVVSYTRDFHWEVLLLLGLGSDVNVQNEKGNTPLHLAMSRLDFCFLNGILKRKLNFDLNIQNNEGNTPLHNALIAEEKFGENSRIVQKLIDNGARVDIMNNDSQTPFHVAKLHSEAEKIVIKHITKMRVAGFSVRVGSEVVDDGYALKCLEEMERIRAIKINGKHTLDTLFSNIENPSYLATSEEFIENLTAPDELKNLFPHYASLLRIQFKCARERFHLFTWAHYFLGGHRKTMYLQVLPYEIKQEIFEYLKNEDLNSLIICMQDSKKMVYLKS